MRKASVFCYSLVCLLSIHSAAHAVSYDRTPSLYARAGIGAMLLDLEESTPFIETNIREQVVGFLEHYDASYRAGPRFDFAIGGKDGPLGDGMIFEANMFFAFHQTNDSHQHDRLATWSAIQQDDPDDPDDDASADAALADVFTNLENYPALRMVGWISAIDGKAVNGPPNWYYGSPIHIRTKRDVQFWGTDFLLGKTFTLSKTGNATMVVGPSYKKLRQESDTFVFSVRRGGDSSVNNMTLREDLDASYYGGVIGIRVDMPLNPRWHLSVDGRVGLYNLRTTYEGQQRTFLSSGTGINENVPCSPEPIGCFDLIDQHTNLPLHDSRFTTSVSWKASLRYMLFDRLAIQAETGLEYLTDTPVIDYADVGESFASDVPHRSARIDYADTFGVLGMVSIVWEM